jgi:hypothetical protein
MLHKFARRWAGPAVVLGAASLFLIPLAYISSTPAAAVSECSDCKIPKGYTTLKQTGEGCTNKLVSCTCTPPGGQPTKSSQEMCLYPVRAGGGGGGLNPPVLTPNTK